MDSYNNKKLRKEIWLILLSIVVVVTFYWLSLSLLNSITFWLMGLVLAFALVFILHKIMELWKVPLVIIGLNLIFNILYTPTADGPIGYYLVEILFILLAILFTIWIYIFSKIRVGIGEDD
jgi:hypothetical protein